MTLAFIGAHRMTLGSERLYSPGNGCTTATWSAPATVAPRGDHRIARYPRLALAERHKYVVGIDIQLFDDEPVSTAPLSIWEIGQKSIGLPHGRFAYLYPRAAIDSHDRLHLFWAEPDTLPPHLTAREWTILQPRTVWSAIYQPESGWSSPHRVEIAPEEPRWQWRGTADNLGDGTVRQGIGLPSMRPPNSLPYLTLEADGTLRQSTIPFAGLYMSLLTRNDWMVAAFAAADPNWSKSSANPVREDANSVFVRISRNRGATWGPAILVQQGGTTPAHQVQALLGKKGEIHLLWKQAYAGGAVIRHVVSPDGASWSKPDDLSATELDNFRAAIDSCGTVQLVAEDWGKGVSRVQLTTASWRGRWNEAHRIFASLEGMTPDLRSSPDGGLYVAFVGRPFAVAGSSAYATYYSRLLQ